MPRDTVGFVPQSHVEDVKDAALDDSEITVRDLRERLLVAEACLAESESVAQELKRSLAAIERSNSYQFSSLLAAHASTLAGWATMPFAIGQFAYAWLFRKQAGGVFVAEPRSLMRRAYQRALSFSYEDGLVFAEKHGRHEHRYVINLLRANAVTKDDEAWARHLNAYLSQFELAPLKVMPGSGPLFYRITSSPGYAIADGDKVSIIMTAFNAQDTIATAVRSVLQQTWRNLELVIVDDASKDGTWNVICELASEDARIKVLQNGANAGPYVARNRALGLCTGDYVTGHDADDWAHPQRIERQVKSLTRDEGVVATWNYMLRVLENGKIDQFTNIDKRSFDGAARLASITAMFDKRWFDERLGYWDSVRFGADSELIARAHRMLGAHFKLDRTIGMICLSVRGSLTNDSVTGNGSSVREAYKAQWRKWHANLSPDNARLDFPQATRKFAAPNSMIVDGGTIERIDAVDGSP